MPTDEPCLRSTDPRAPLRAGSAWCWAIVLGTVGFFLIHPYDGQLNAWATAFAKNTLRGDLHRELFAWQQYGQGVAIAVIALAIFLVDPRSRVRLWDLGLAVVLAKITVQLAKMFIGRPRPREIFDDPHTFLGPWGEYPIFKDGQWRLVHAWDTANGAGTDLWAMPSSHTMFAFVLSVFLARVYPPLRALVFALAVLVAFSRVLFDAHWPTDVIVGAAAGYALGSLVVDQAWGRRIAARFFPAVRASLPEH
jgi:membrane-associated phospholipid phosphatase